MMMRNRDSAGRDRQANDAIEDQEDEVGASADGSGSTLELDATAEDAEAPQETEGDRALAALNDKYMRLAAEFDNFRRRINRERAEWGERAQATLASSLLESLDDLARVVSSENEQADAASIVQGANLVARKMFKALNGAGLEVLDPVNEAFDPKMHEAVSTEPATNADQDDTVSIVFQPGYMFKGQLLRPARVVVRKWHG